MPKRVTSKINLGHPVFIDRNKTHLERLITYTTSCTQAFLNEHCTIQGLRNLEQKLVHTPRAKNAAIADNTEHGYRMRTQCTNSRVLKMVQDRGISVMKGYLWRLHHYLRIVEQVYQVELTGEFKIDKRERARIENALPIPKEEARALVRPVWNHCLKNPDIIPEFFDVFNHPRLKVSQANLGVGDKVAYRRTIDLTRMVYLLEAKLPTVDDPTDSKEDWVWEII